MRSEGSQAERSSRCNTRHSHKRKHTCTHEYAAIQYTYVYTMIRTYTHTYEYITHIHQYTCARRFIAQTQTLTSFPMYKEVAKCTTTMAKAIMPQQ